MRPITLDGTSSLHLSAEGASYINPFFSNVEDEFSLSGDGSSRTTMGKKPRNLYQEGVANKYFVKSPMNHDVPYKFHSGSIEFCMLGTHIL